MLPLVLHSVAETEAAEAAQWYAARSPDLAVRFLLELDIALRRIRHNPESFQLARAPLRRCLLVHFPASGELVGIDIDRASLHLDLSGLEAGSVPVEMVGARKP